MKLQGCGESSELHQGSKFPASISGPARSSFGWAQSGSSPASIPSPPLTPVRERIRLFLSGECRSLCIPSNDTFCYQLTKLSQAKPSVFFVCLDKSPANKCPLASRAAQIPNPSSGLQCPEPLGQPCAASQPLLPRLPPQPQASFQNLRPNFVLLLCKIIQMLFR